MLVLSRKLGEKIVIDGNITITVVEVRGEKVRIGVDAPQNVTVHREEIAQQIAQDRVKAKSSPEA